MALEKTVSEILSKTNRISREEIYGKLEEARRMTDGLVSDGVLLRMIAAECGVKILEKPKVPRLPLKEVVPGLNDVTVTGRVIAIFPSERPRGDRAKRPASLLIADKEGVIRVTLWDEKGELVESGRIKTGLVIRILHAYSREGYDGKVELHLGNKSRIDLDPKNVEEAHYPTMKESSTRIGEITQTMKNVNILGNVKKIYPVSFFKRKDSSQGKVMSIIFADETGETRVAVWNEKVDELEGSLKDNDTLCIVNARVKKTSNGRFEIHVNRHTYVEIVSSTVNFIQDS